MSARPVAEIRAALDTANQRKLTVFLVDCQDIAVALDAADAMARLLESIDEGSNVVARWRELGGLS